jgi:hypothetical protein
MVRTVVPSVRHRNGERTAPASGGGFGGHGRGRSLGAQGAQQLVGAPLADPGGGRELAGGEPSKQGKD